MGSSHSHSRHAENYPTGDILYETSCRSNRNSRIVPGQPMSEYFPRQTLPETGDLPISVIYHEKQLRFTIEDGKTLSDLKQFIQTYYGIQASKKYFMDAGSDQYLSDDSIIDNMYYYLFDYVSEAEDYFSIQNKIEIKEEFLCKKPVLMLYPTQPMDVEITINPQNAQFTCVYPQFTSENTWKAHCDPSGMITVAEKKCPYLFWEANSYSSFDLSKGFLVRRGEGAKFLEEKLSEIGLNEKEMFDFITFWLPILDKNEMSLCSFQFENYDKQFPLAITPKPDSILRVFLVIKKIDASIDIEPQQFNKFERNGFTAVEWGGSAI